MLSVFLLSFGCRASEDDYSFSPPILLTNASEIGNWTLRGNAINTKQYIRLTSEIPNQFGGVCNRIPTTFDDWIVELSLKSHHGVGGSGFYFYFTKELCPTMPLLYKGFSIWINTTATDAAGRSPIYYTYANGTFVNPNTIKPSGYIKIRDNSTSTRIAITKSGTSILVKHDFDLLFEAEFPKGIIDRGYFTLYALTNMNHGGDNQDITYFKTYNLSPKENIPNLDKLSYQNMKTIATARLQRRGKKSQRRNAMITSLHYQNETKDHNEKLTSEAIKTDELSDALKIISESIIRSGHHITYTELNNFISGYLRDTIEKADEKINLALNNYDSLRFDTSRLWDEVRSSMTELAIDSRAQMELFGKEVMKLAKDIHLEKVEPSAVINQTPEASSSKLTQILFYICLVEGIAYVIFFIHRHRKTEGFKKRD